MQQDECITLSCVLHHYDSARVVVSWLGNARYFDSQRVKKLIMLPSLNFDAGVTANLAETDALGHWLASTK